MKKTLLLITVLSSISFSENLFETQLGLGKIIKSEGTEVASNTKLKLELPYEMKLEGDFKFDKFGIFKNLTGVKLSKTSEKYGTIELTGKLNRSLRLGYNKEFKFNNGLSITGGIEAEKIFRNREQILSKYIVLTKNKDKILDEIYFNDLNIDDIKKWIETSPNLKTLFTDRINNILKQNEEKTKEVEKFDRLISEALEYNKYLDEAVTTQTLKPYLLVKYKNDNVDVESTLSYIRSYDNVKTKIIEDNEQKEIKYKVEIKNPAIDVKGFYDFKDYNTKVGADLYLDGYIRTMKWNDSKEEKVNAIKFSLNNYVQYEYKKDKFTVTPRFDVNAIVLNEKTYSDERFLIEKLKMAPIQELVTSEKNIKTFVFKPALKVNYEIKEGFDVYSKFVVKLINTKVNAKIGQEKLPEKRKIQNQLTLY